MARVTCIAFSSLPSKPPLVARNAEEHSSALAAEVRSGRDRAQVVIRVKNGITYAIADFERAGSGSTGSIQLNVATSGRRNDLLDALVEGC